MILLFFGDWWNTLSGIQQIFWGISIVFSVLFVIQFVLSLIGLDFDGDGDLDIEVSTNTDTGYSLDADFTLLSVRSIIAFFTFFGWTGVMVLNAGGSVLAAVGFSSLAGLAAMFIVGYMMYMFHKLSQSGTINLETALYNTGKVYLTIPANKNGYGKVNVKVQGTIKEVDAVTEGDALPTGSNIRIIQVLDDNLLLVEPVESFLPEGK